MINLDGAVCSKKPEDPEAILEVIETGFPDTVFPQELRETVLSMCEYNQNIPPDFIKASIFAACASALGKSVHAEEGGEKPILWTLLVGRPGCGKTSAIKMAYAPFKPIAEANQAEYKIQMREWNAADRQGDKPFLRLPVHYKATLEGIADELEQNPKGTTIVQEEIKSWLDNHTRNSRGSDYGYYTTSWDGNPTSEATRYGKKFYCAEPCLNVIGGIQDGVLEKTMCGNKLEDGFFERWLFVMNHHKRKPRPPKSHAAKVTEAKYSEIINRIYNTVFAVGELPLSPDAQDWWKRWCDLNNDYINQYNEEGNFSLANVLSKWEKYLIRFALEIQALRCILNGEPTAQISVECMELADLVRQYYLKNTATALSMIHTPEHLRGLTEWQILLYRQLPDGQFTKADAAKILQGIIPTLSADQIRGRLTNFLSKENLFIRKGQGEYQRALP